jgi:hypothetical protein
MILSNDEYEIELEIEENAESDLLDFAFVKGFDMKAMIKKAFKLGYIHAHKKLTLADGEMFLIVSKPNTLH